MTSAISSAQPLQLFRYSDITTRIDSEIAAEANRLAGVLRNFEATCTEYRVPVAHLADSVRGHAYQAEAVDVWVRTVGAGFWAVDQGASIWAGIKQLQWLKGVLQPALAGGIIATSIRMGSAYEGEIIINLPQWLKHFGLSLREVRSWAGLSPFLNHIKYTNIPSHMLRIGVITSVPIIAWKWGGAWRDYISGEISGRRLASTMTVDAALTLAPVGASFVGAKMGALAGAQLGALLGSVVPGLGTVAGAIVGGAAGAIIGGVAAGIAASWAIDHYDIREKAIDWVEKKAIPWLDEHIFRPVATAIAKGVEAFNNGVDEAARRLRSGLQAVSEAGSAVRSWVGEVRIILDSDKFPSLSVKLAVALLASRTSEIDRNTAHHLVNGTVKVYCIQDLQHYENEVEILEQEGFDPGRFSIYVNPENGEPMLVQKDYVGFTYSGSTTIYVNKYSYEIGRILVHELNHALNESTDGVVEYYKSEFRAYWVDGTFDSYDDNSKKAEAIRSMLVSKYDYIKIEYEANENVRKMIDAIEYPEGNLVNK